MKTKILSKAEAAAVHAALKALALVKAGVSVRLANPTRRVECNVLSRVSVMEYGENCASIETYSSAAEFAEAYELYSSHTASTGPK